MFRSSSLESLGFGPFASTFSSTASALGSDVVPARVTSVLGSQLTIDGDACGRAELSGRLRHELLPEERPTVGDWVVVAPSDHLSIIHAVLPRRTQLVRQGESKRARARADVQVVAANVDTFFVVTSANHDANARRLERYISAIARGGAEAVIAVNKIDLQAREEAEQLVASLAVVAPHVPVIGVSAVTGAGMSGITDRLEAGRTVAFVGSSGVGKSSLVNRLLAIERQATLPIDENDRGRHATTRRELIVLPDERGVLIDTPGMRSFGITDDEGLEATFADIVGTASACRFRDCRHHGEPGCAVAEAIDRGALDEERVAAYEKLEREANASTTSSIRNGHGELRAGAAGVDPCLERGDELLVRERRHRALAARVPAPLHERVVRDVIEQRGEIAIAGLRGVLELRTQRRRRQAHEHLVRGRQSPVRRARWTTRETDRVLGVAILMTRRARDTGVDGLARDVLRVWSRGVALARAIVGRMAVRAAR